MLHKGREWSSGGDRLARQRRHRQGVIAFISGIAVDAVRLKNACKMSLPDYMVPSRIIVVDDMPLNASGKMDSVVLRARLAK